MKHETVRIGLSVKMRSGDIADEDEKILEDTGRKT